MRIVVTGGGTGGHIYPALAVAETLRSQGHDVLYVGKRDSMESELVPERGIPFEGVDFFGMPRKPGLALIRWFFSLRRARETAKKHLQQFKPERVFGTGGYVSGPVLMAARALKIPYLLHEPDAFPGMANRLMARHAEAITAAFADSKSHFKLGEQTMFQVTGNPIRQDLGLVDKATAFARMGVDWNPSQPTLLIFGGSQGARTINTAVIQALDTLLNQMHCQVIHLTGKSLYDETVEAIRQRKRDLLKHPGYYLRPFSQDMPILMGAADLALCRAGSLTLSETYAAGLPSVLIPYPHAAADHQRKNAQASARAGASMVVEDADCSGEQLITVLADLMTDPTRLPAMKTAAHSLAHPEATQTIARLITDIPKASTGFPLSRE